MTSPRKKIRITIEGRRVSAAGDRTVLEALIDTGVMLRSDCGGKGRCGKCRIRVRDPESKSLSPPGAAETEILGVKDLAAGYRLACCAALLDDVALEIPAGSRVSASVLEKAPPLLLKEHALSKTRVAALKDAYGLAVDLGTTTIAIYLCELATGNVKASMALRNPQAIFGDDVMSRISAIGKDPDLLGRLQRMAVKTIDWGARALMRSGRLQPSQIKSMTVVGNSIMMHIFVGQNPASMGVYPYAPGFVEEKRMPAGSIGLRFNPDAEIRTLPLITGFIGADTVGAALAARLQDHPVGTLLVDVGTNGEIMFLGKEGLVAASCATGPAFEGATIEHGMQAVAGAIDAVKISRNRRNLSFSVIQNSAEKSRPPSGICGTGVISAVAELLRAGVISKNGAFNSKAKIPNLQRTENGALQFILVAPEKTSDGRAIGLTQKDVRAVQLAKGALRTGIELLCRETHTDFPRKILLAGAFGNYIKPKDALTLGMFFGLAPEAIEGVGNAAGAGAILALLDEGFMHRAAEISRTTRVLDLSTHPDFQETFISALAFP